ncbi:uncharacterized protein LOC129720288 [Wyeomyia smithii]|uniref:uncharacterized protein LOC129720288 n=1 Tax=Wyeomyia smithii TaxID=174621 RepID=UPI002467E4EA|nr:uncharacterized protein LOC129720288 [Wyeomyia smithii]
MGRKCEVISCASNDNKNCGKSFYKFPTCENICYEWVKFCKSAYLEQLFYSCGPTALNQKKMCSDHFGLESLRDPSQKDKGLKAGSIPTPTDNPTNAIQRYMSDGHQVALDQREDFFEYEYLDELTILRGNDESVVYESYLVDNTLEDQRSSYEVDLCEPIVEGNSALHDDFINYPMEELPIPSETNPVVILEITPTTLEEIDVEEISNLDNFDQICEVIPSSGNDEENIQSLNFRY